MTFHGFITVRSDSSRLPRKAFQKLGSKALIENIIERAKSIKGLDAVVICTTDRPEDDELAAIAEKWGVLCFRGSLDDKLERWRGAAEKFNTDYLITIDGDDPFCDPALCEAAIAQIKRDEPDFMEAPEGLAIGAFTYAIKRTALEKVCDIKDSENTEMMWVYFTDTGLFTLAKLEVRDPVVMHPLRLTLDYPEDLAFFRKVFEDMRMSENTVPLHDIMAYLLSHPETVAINAFRHEEWKRNQIAKTALRLKQK